MKAIFRTSLVIAAAAVAFASCQREEMAVPAEGTTVNFVAVSTDAKATFGTPDGTTYPVLWTSNDVKAKVSVNLANGLDAAVTVAEDNKSAVLSAPGLKDDASGSYTFYGVSPQSAYLSCSAQYQSVGVTVPSTQTPSATSVDEAAMVLIGQTATLSEFPTDYVEMPFKHFTAYGLLSFANLNLDGATISSVELVSSENITGRWYSYVEDGHVEVSSGVKSVVINTSATENIWFAIAPVDLTGTALTVVVNTDKGTYTREFQALAKGNFESGKIAKLAIDMNGIAPVKNEVTYTLVKNASELSAGSQVLIATLAGDWTFSSTQNANNRAAEAVTAVDGVISTIGSAVEIFDVEAGAQDGTWAFKATKTPGYIYAAGGTAKSNYLKTAEEKSVLTSWNVSIAADGTATIVCADASVVRNTIMKNSSSPLFSCYASGQTAVAIYKSNAPAVVPADPELLTLTTAMVSTNDPMQYVVGGSDTYGFASNPDWFAAINESQATARRNKFGLVENLSDDDPATCFHTNMDWGSPNTSWETRGGMLDRSVLRYIQVDLLRSVDEMKIVFKSSDAGNAADGYIVMVSTDKENYAQVGETLVDNAFGKEYTVENIKVEGVQAIRIVNTKNDADWTSVASAFGLAELKIWDMKPRFVDVTKVAGFAVSSASTSVVAGTVVPLDFEVSPATAVNKSIVWNTSDTSVATVADGVVTTVAAGEVTITGTTIDGGYTGSVTFSVSEIPAITLSASDITTNDPMQYVVGGSDAYGFASNPDWFAAITSEQTAARRAKFGLAENMLDGDPATCFHTNLDWGAPNTSWGTRGGMLDRWTPRYIQIDLPQPYSAFRLWFKSSDAGHAADGYQIQISSDKSEYSDFGSALGSNSFGAEFTQDITGSGIQSIRIVNTNTDADWTSAANGFGIAELKVWSLE